MAEHPPEIYDDLDVLLRSARFAPEADYTEELRSHLRASLVARQRMRPFLGRMRAWIFSYPNGYRLHEEKDATMHRSKLLTAFSVCILVLALAAFVGLVIVLPSLESPGEAGSPVFDTAAPALDTATGGSPTDGIPAGANTQPYPFEHIPKDIVEWDFLVDGIVDSSNLVSITADNITQIQELVDVGQVGIEQLAFSPDGRFLAADAGLWDLKSGMGLVFSGWSGGNHMAFSSDSTILAVITGPENRNTDYIYILDLGTGAVLRKLDPPYPLEVVAFAPDGSKLVTGSGAMSTGPGYVELWDARSGERLFSALQDGSAKYLAISPDGRVIASGAPKGVICLWNAELEPLATIEVPGVIAGLAFSPDGRWLAYGNQKTVRVWDVAGGVGHLALEGHTELVKGVTFSPDGSFLASVGQDGTLRLWDVVTGRELVTLVLATEGPIDPSATGTPDPDNIVASWSDSLNDWVTGIAFSPDGKLLATGFEKEPVMLWGIPSGN